MRRLLLLSAALLVAACTDNQQPTSPAAGRSVTPNGSAAGQIAPSPQAKPTDQVGFTTAFTVTTPLNSQIDGVTFTGWTLHATCPAGSTVVSGGYRIPVGWPYAKITYNGPDGANGWQISVDEANAAAIQFQAFAMCAQ